MKKLTIILTLAVTLISLSINSVFAIDNPTSEYPYYQEARAAVEAYINGGGLTPEICPPGITVSNPEIIEMIPSAFVLNLNEDSYTPKEIASNADSYYAIVGENGVPTNIIHVSSQSASVISAGPVYPEFIDRLSVMRSLTTNGEVCVVIMDSANSWFYGETPDGNVALPEFVYPDQVSTFASRYTPNIVVPQDDFEVMYGRYRAEMIELRELAATNPELLPMGGADILRFAPNPNKWNIWIVAAVAVALSTIVSIIEIKKRNTGKR